MQIDISTLPFLAMQGCVCVLLRYIYPQPLLIQYTYSNWPVVNVGSYTPRTETFHIESHALKNTRSLPQCCATCNYKVPTVLGFCVHSAAGLTVNAMLHISMFCVPNSTF